MVTILQERLACYNDLHLTLKHVHWNVVGPHFIGVHEMIDPQVELVREFADQVAERIAALGASPKGTPGAIIADPDLGGLPAGPRHRARTTCTSSTRSTTGSSSPTARQWRTSRSSTWSPRTS